MLNDADSILAALAGTMLAGRQVVELAPAEHETDPTFAVRCGPDEVLVAWNSARSVVAATGRWPVVLTHWDQSGDDDWLLQEAAERQAALETRSRWHERHGAPAKEDIPDLSVVLDGLEVHPTPEEYWGSTIDWQLEVTARDFGSAPTAEEARAALGGRRLDHQLDRWLLDWELERIGEGASPSTATDWHLSPYVPAGQCAVFLFPTPAGWETFSSQGFFGLAYDPVRLGAFVRSWHQRFGAELMANWDTMLEFVVTRPPTTIHDAWQLAYEQVLVAPYTIRGPVLPLRRHAQALLGRPAWFLHERP